MSLSKKLTCQGSLRQVFIFFLIVYLSEAQNPINVYTLYTYSHREGGRGGESLTREKVRGATVHKAGSKILI
jgi:hypothetical protein